MLDKITFLQFSCLPGIIAERLFTIFESSAQSFIRSSVDPVPVSSFTQMISSSAFVENMSRVFMGSFEQKAFLCFKM